MKTHKPYADSGIIRKKWLHKHVAETIRIGQGQQERYFNSVGFWMSSFENVECIKINSVTEGLIPQMRYVRCLFAPCRSVVRGFDWVRNYILVVFVRMFMEMRFVVNSLDAYDPLSNILITGEHSVLFQYPWSQINQSNDTINLGKGAWIGVNVSSLIWYWYWECRQCQKCVEKIPKFC